MATRDLLYVLDRLLHVTWNRNPSPSSTHPYNPYLSILCVCMYKCVCKSNADDELMMWVVKR